MVDPQFTIDLHRFVIQQLIPPDQEEKFKAWLGNRANQKYIYPQWMYLWEEFQRSVLDLELV